MEPEGWSLRKGAEEGEREGGEGVVLLVGMRERGSEGFRKEERKVAGKERMNESVLE